MNRRELFKVLFAAPLAARLSKTTVLFTPKYYSASVPAGAPVKGQIMFVGFRAHDAGERILGNRYNSPAGRRIGGNA